MAVMDEFKEEREAIKTAPFKKRAEYFFDYYKWHTIVTIVSVVLIISIIYEVASTKDTVFYAGFANVYVDEAGLEAIEAEYLTYIELDSSSEAIVLDTTYYLDYVSYSNDHSTYLQKLVTLVSTGTLDTLAADEVSFAHMAYSSMLMDVESYLTDEEMEKYADIIAYIDLEVLAEIEELNDLGDFTGEYPDYIIGTAEEMAEPMAVGFYITDETNLDENIAFQDSTGIIGIVGSTGNLENAKVFIEYALSEGE